MPSRSHVRVISNKGVNTVSKVVPIWPALRYILDTDQYRCTVLGLSLLYIYIYIYIYVCICVCVYIIINIKVYHKTFHQFRTNYSWFQTLVSIKRKKKHNIKNRKLKSYRLVLPEISRYGRNGRYLNRYEMLIFQYRYIYWYATYQPV